MWITRGSRFNAYRRLKNRSSLSIVTITLFSVLILMVSIASRFQNLSLSFGRSDSLDYLLVSLTVILLVLSILENGQNYMLRADRLFQSANDISEQYDELRNRASGNKSISASYFKQKVNAYYAILRRCPENHEPLDMFYFKANNPEEFKMNYAVKIYRTVSYYLFGYFLYWLLIVLEAVVIKVVFF